MNKSKKEFPLKKLLKYRKYQLDKAKLEYQDQLNICRDIKNNIEKNYELKKKLEMEIYIKQSHGISVSEIISYMDYLKNLEGQIIIFNDNLKKAESMLDLKFKQLVKSLQDKKSLELQDKKFFENYKKYILKKEQKILDEINSNRFIISMRN
ncbi:MAG: flagellar export protein FliJ [Thermodesulfobacteriota bacterium]|nr:flagellar export protein FliJ [Thermodesulfobacteriota bacterium]